MPSNSKTTKHNNVYVIVGHLAQSVSAKKINRDFQEIISHSVGLASLKMRILKCDSSDALAE